MDTGVDADMEEPISPRANVKIDADSSQRDQDNAFMAHDDYKLVASAVRVLENQREQCNAHLEQLTRLKIAALDDPTLFVASLLNKDINKSMAAHQKATAAPKPLKIVRIPPATFAKYNVCYETPVEKEFPSPMPDSPLLFGTNGELPRGDAVNPLIPTIHDHSLKKHDQQPPSPSSFPASPIFKSTPKKSIYPSGSTRAPVGQGLSLHPQVMPPILQPQNPPTQTLPTQRTTSVFYSNRFSGARYLNRPTVRMPETFPQPHESITNSPRDLDLELIMNNALLRGTKEVDELVQLLQLKERMESQTNAANLSSFSSPAALLSHTPSMHPQIHTGFQCDSCECDPILGPRMHCSTCQDIDLCLECWKAGWISSRHQPECIVVEIAKAEETGAGAGVDEYAYLGTETIW